MFSLINDLSNLSLGSMASFVRRAETLYDENLAAYVRFVLQKFVPKLFNFVEGAEKLLKTAAPSDVAGNSSYNKAALKKVIKDNTTKDVRRNVDAMFKRVEKNFEGEEGTTGAGGGAVMPGTALFVVWQACEDEMVKLTERFLKFIATCHKDVNAELSVGDVEAAFKKHRA